MVDSPKEVPVDNKHFAEHGYTVPQEILALVTSGELIDLSWHNDASPSYGVVLLDEVNVCIWVDHVERKAREVLDKRFFVSSYNHEHVNLHPFNDGQILSTDDVAEAITKWRETVADLKAQIADPRPRVCEACNIGLKADRTCPECGVSHSGDACPTCGGFALHKPDCDQRPLGNGFECGPKYVAPEEEHAVRLSTAETNKLVETFDRAYQYYKGWGFAYEHPGIFTYYQLGGDLRVCFTPDWTEPGQVDVQVHDASGDSLDNQGGDHDFTKDHSAPALFRIVKPYLDSLADKSAADLRVKA